MSTNLTKHNFLVSREQREKNNGHPGIVIWFTGLSGSGKSTLADKLFSYLIEGKYKVEIIDGDAVREKDEKNKFTTEEIIINNQGIIGLCENLQKEYDYLLVTVIAPFKKTRKEAKEKFSSNYIEVYVKTNLGTVIERDTKGLYKKARLGIIKGFTGIDDPYEPPLNPDIDIDTTDITIEEATNRIITYLKENGLI